MQSNANGCVLVLDADSRAGLATVQSLGDVATALHVAIRSDGSLTARSRWSKRLYRQPKPESIQTCIAWLRDLHAQHQFDLIVPATEASLLWLRQIDPDDPIRKAAVLPSNDALDTALSKERTHQLADALGLPVPRSRLLTQGVDHQDTDHFDFPSVLKPVASKVLVHGRLLSLAPVIVRDNETRTRTLAEWIAHTDVQEQQWVAGRGVGVELVYARGRVVADFVHERLHELPLTGGGSTWRRAAKPDLHLLELSRRLMDRLQWHGVAMVEWRRGSDGSLHLMEINPRLWGSLPLTIAAGVDVPKILLQIARNAAPAKIMPWRIGITARNVIEDLRWMKTNARANRADPQLLTEPLPSAIFGWLRIFTLREVYDGWKWRDPAIALAEISAIAGGIVSRFARIVRDGIERRRVAKVHSALFARNGRPAQPVKNVLFLCYGNICRSPFAEAVARTELPRLHIESAGFHANVGRASPAHLIEAARRYDIDLSDCASKLVSESMVDAADLIVVMDYSHLARLRSIYPKAMPRTTLLGLFNPNGPIQMEDPYSLSAQRTQVVLQQMVDALKRLISTLST